MHFVYRPCAILLLALLPCLAAPLQAQTIGEVPSAFSYQGFLKKDGVPASGSHDFRFQLYDFAVNGNQVGPTVDVNGVMVAGGVFTVSLDFGNVSGSVWDGSRWLRTFVRPAGGGAYTELTPRTKLAGAPYAMGLSTPLDVVDAYGGALLSVKNEYSVGSPTAIWAESTAEGGIGLTGRATADAGENKGVYGLSSSPSGTGVYGRVTAAGALGEISAGVRGEATAASGPTYGVQGTAVSPGGYGVYGVNTATTSLPRGVMGRTYGPNGRGVEGAHTSTTGEGTGVYGESVSSVGHGVYGRVTAGGASSVLSSIAVRGEAFSTTGFTYGVVGSTRSPEGYGVYGVSNATTGSKAGVYGSASSAQGYGVYARNTAAGGFAAYFSEQVRIDDALMLHNGSGAEPTIIIDASEGTGGLASIKLRRGSTNVIELDADHNGDGRIITQELEITGGSDLSENFDVAPAFGVDVPLPGMVVSIDPAHPGRLRPSGTAYDPLVAGIVSGGGDVETGLIMGQEGSIADGAFPVALVGRVYVFVDAAYGPVRPGDLLTTSETPGHAMRAADRDRAAGAVLGKAMTGLDAGRGLVLVLVTLQ